MLRLHAVLLAALLLSGCAGVADQMGVEDPFSVPQPFRAEPGDPKVVGSILEEPAIFVGDIAGISPATATDLRQRIAIAAQGKDVVATADTPVPRARTLTGTITDDASTILARFQLADGGGFELRRAGSTNALDAATLDALANDVALKLSQITGAARAAAASVAPTTPQIVVAPVTGAPGDGGLELTRAVWMSLKQLGIDVAERPVDNAYRVQGRVTVTGTGPERNVAISWTVTDPSGATLGTIDQKSKLPASVVEGHWGEQAALAGNAAAKGLVDLLRKLPAPRRS